MNKGNGKTNKLDSLKRGAWLRPMQYVANELEVILGAGKTKIRQWTDEGRLPSYFIDGLRYYHADDVNAFVEKYRPSAGFELGNEEKGESDGNNA